MLGSLKSDFFDCRLSRGYGESKDIVYTRLAMATFWRTFHHDEKISPGWWEWEGCTPSPFHCIYHHVQSCGVHSSCEAVLPTRRLFGWITQKGPNIKSRVAEQSCSQILADLVQKGQKRGQAWEKFVFLLLFFHPGQIKEISYFSQARSQKEPKIFIHPNAFK